MEFVLSSEAINRYGYKVLTTGIDISNFLKNPVMFFNHNTYAMPIGKWTNIKKTEDGKLIGTPEFDENDATAKEVKRKVEAGYLNATSIGFNIKPRAVKEDENGCCTITSCDLLEVSIVGTPANSEAVRLSFEDSSMMQFFNKQSIQHIFDMSKIAQQLGLSADATEAQIVSEIQKLQGSVVDAALSAGEAKGLVTAENKTIYAKLAASDLVSFNELVANHKAPAPQKPQEKLLSIAQQLAAGKTQGADNRLNWNFNEWEEKDPEGLLSMEHDQPEKFGELLKTYKGRKL